MRLPRRLPLLLLPAAACLLTGFDYGVPVLVETDSDLYELEASGEITSEERDQLLDLLYDPLDLNTATREDLQKLPDVTYRMAEAIIGRRMARPFRRPRELQEVIGAQAWQQSRPFVTVSRPRARMQTRGSVSLRGLDKLGDDRSPLAYTRARLSQGRSLDAGVMVAEQQGLRGVDYSGGIVRADASAPRIDLERVHLRYDAESWSAIAGHYQAGFGLGLVFDTTERTHPYGFRHDLKLYEDYEDYDSYTVGRRLFGAAGQLRVPVGSATRLDLTAFGSAASHDLYYAYLSPHDYSVSGAPDLSYPTFPDVYREDLAGANATLWWGETAHVGFTGWAGHAVKAYDFDFTSTPIPNRSSYGAAGADFAWIGGPFELLGEGAVTDTGGLGGRTELVWSATAGEIDAAFRYYGTGFDNPHSRGRAEPDTMSRQEEDGLVDPSGWRDRDELGPELVAVYYPVSWIRLRGKGDAWRRPSLDRLDGYAEGRADIDPLSWLGIDLQADLRDKDLSTGGRDQVYDTSDPADEHGQRWTASLGFRVKPVHSVTIQGWYKEAFEDIASSTDSYERTHYAWVKVSWRPTDALRLDVRGKVYDERVADPVGEHYDSGYVQCVAKLPERLSLLGRYELRRNLDTDALPNPEHMFKVGVDWKF